MADIGIDVLLEANAHLVGMRFGPRRGLLGHPARAGQLEGVLGRNGPGVPGGPLLGYGVDALADQTLRFIPGLAGLAERDIRVFAQREDTLLSMEPELEAPKARPAFTRLQVEAPAVKDAVASASGVFEGPTLRVGQGQDPSSHGEGLVWGHVSTVPSLVPPSKSACDPPFDRSWIQKTPQLRGVRRLWIVPGSS